MTVVVDFLSLLLPLWLIWFLIDRFLQGAGLRVFGERGMERFGQLEDVCLCLFALLADLRLLYLDVFASNTMRSLH